MENEMSIKIKLDIGDALLKGALEIMVRESGFDACEDESEPLYVITDSTEKAPLDSNTLCVSREEIPGRVCLIRPFDSEDLKIALDKLTNRAVQGTKRESSAVRIDKKRLTVFIAGERIRLTEKELKLFSLLYENRDKAVSDSEIVEKVFGSETVSGSNIAAVYVNYLRKKLDERLGKRMIYRVRGEGYLLKIDERE